MAHPLHLQFYCCNDIQLTAQIINHCMMQSYTCCFQCPDIPRCTLTVRCHILCLRNSDTLVAYTNCLICHVLTQCMLVFVWLDTSSAVFKSARLESCCEVYCGACTEEYFPLSAAHLSPSQDQPQMYSCLPSLSHLPAQNTCLCFVFIITLTLNALILDCVWNVIAHAQKPDFVFRQNGRVHLNRWGRQFSPLLAAEVCASAVVMLDTPCSEVVWRVLTTYSTRQFPLHFPSHASLRAITFQPDSTSWWFKSSGLWCRVIIWAIVSDVWKDHSAVVLRINRSGEWWKVNVMQWLVTEQ